MAQLGLTSGLHRLLQRAHVLLQRALLLLQRRLGRLVLGNLAVLLLALLVHGNQQLAQLALALDGAGPEFLYKTSESVCCLQ